MYLLDNLKEKAKNFLGKNIPPPIKSVFEKDGRLTPQEFTEAGDKLVQVSGTWNWKPAKNKKKVNQYLHESKQILCSQLVSRERLGDIDMENEIEHFKPEDFNVDIITPENKTENIDKQQVVQKPQLLLDSDDENDDQVVSQVNKNVRIYNVFISYDNYYHTPRFWLSGLDYNNQPLSIDQIYEDIASDYKGKTVTEMINPYEECQMASIHPCKHASAIHKLYTQAKDNGENYKVIDYFAVFFKFMSSVMPGLQFDYTYSVQINSQQIIDNKIFLIKKINFYLIMLGKILLLISVSYIGFALNNNALKRTELLTKLDEYQQKISYQLNEQQNELLMNVLFGLVMMSLLSLCSYFKFAGLFGGLSLILVNFLLNFEPEFGIDPTFVILNLLALGTIFSSIF